MEYGETIVVKEKVDKLKELLKSVKDLNGDVVEIGVYFGGTALEIAKIENKNTIHIFDTFNGMPNFSEEKDKKWVIGSFKGADFEKIKNLFLNYDNVKIYDGIFPNETFENIKKIKLKFVHIDVDNYQSYKDSLSAIYENVVENGIIIFDDYNESCCPGANLAIDEFFKNKERIIFDNTYYIIKGNF